MGDSTGSRGATEEDVVVDQYGHYPLETLTHVTIDHLLLFFIPVGNSDNIEAGGISASHTQHRWRRRCRWAI